MAVDGVTLDAMPVTVLKGVAERQSARLERLGVTTVADLLFHLPGRYQDRSRVVSVGALQPGQEALIDVRVVVSEIVARGRRSLLCRVEDGTGGLLLRFFHFSTAQHRLLTPGAHLRCFGEVRAGVHGLEMIHPEMQRFQGPPPPPEPVLTAVYPTTEGLSQYTWRRLMTQALDKIVSEPVALPDHLPAGWLNGGLPDLHSALDTVHRPPQSADLHALLNAEHPAQRRLALEELIAHQIGLRRLRQRLQSYRATPLGRPGPLRARFLEALPFALTAAQGRVLTEIDRDLARPRPMLRLVQGDVGSGKTVVAALAALRAVESGRQAAIMAPTELLAEQHLRNFRHWLEPLDLTVGWLSGKARGKSREQMLSLLADGGVQLVVGTHALFQDEVKFADLALVIIDEQHRFGVHQRLALRDKGRGGGRVPHQLIMTATPIPRTLAMSAYADLDTSIIDELPPGRAPIKTVAIADSRRQEVVDRVRAACRQGRQAYWVCTLIEESEVLAAEAAEDTAKALAEALPDQTIGLVHGRLKPVEKDAVMQRFQRGELDLLVATTVIEVGVDVPNASLMIIENAERLGLAQLHQLRGRVGRGSVASICVLLYHPPLSDTARLRLSALRDSQDGFEIARRDLELRGPGEVLGTRQTGELQFRVADLMRDEDLLPRVRDLADRLIDEAPQGAEALRHRWVGESDRYGGV